MNIPIEGYSWMYRVRDGMQWFLVALVCLTLIYYIYKGVKKFKYEKH